MPEMLKNFGKQTVKQTFFSVHLKKVGYLDFQRVATKSAEKYPN